MPYVSDVGTPGMRRRSGDGDCNALVLPIMPSDANSRREDTTKSDRARVMCDNFTTIEPTTDPLVQEQREEMRSLREDALPQKGRRSYADVTRTTQVKPTNTTLLVGNELLQDIHVDETKDGDPIKIRRLSGAAFDAIGSMIDDAATEDRIKEIIIVAGTHEMTEDIPVEQIQVDFEVLLRKAQAVTSEITVSSVLPVIRDNAIKLGRLIEVNERLKAQRRSQDFCLGGGHFSMISAGRPDSVGGGGSTRNFPGSPLAGQIQWGGG